MDWSLAASQWPWTELGHKHRADCHQVGRSESKVSVTGMCMAYSWNCKWLHMTTTKRTSKVRDILWISYPMISR